MPTGTKNSIVLPESLPVGETPAEEIRRLNGEFRAHALSMTEIENIFRQKYDMDAPTIPKATKAKTGLVDEQVVQKVRDALTGQHPFNATRFNNVLGLAGITGTADTTAARAELEARGIIKVTEIGTGKGKGGAKSITLVEGTVS